MTSTTPNAMLAALQALKASRKALEPLTESIHNPAEIAPSIPKYFAANGAPLNEQQSEAVDLAISGRSFCLIGAAGSGKTTTLREVIQHILKTFPEEPQAKSIALVSFTRRAVANIRKAVADIGASQFCHTIHSFLEYCPEDIEYLTADGEAKTSRQFRPRRHEMNPILECKLIIIDESSMVSYADLYRNLREACPNAIFIFVGDLNQLKPVFGDAVLGHKLNSIPVVELTHIYRQAMDSPIVGFQHKFTLAGRVPTTLELEAYTTQGQLQFHPIRRCGQDGESIAFRIFENYLKPRLDSGEYDPELDVILVPKNEGLGQVTFNLLIAQHLGQKRNAEIHEIRANGKAFYYAPGDLVQANKIDCEILSIMPNKSYRGAWCKPSSTKMTRWGFVESNESDFDLFDDVLANFKVHVIAKPEEDSDDKDSGGRAGSHIVTVRNLETGDTLELKSNAQLLSLQLNYAMTIHRSQGSEWRRVHLILHNSAAAMLSRELLYTGMTRAKEQLSVLYSPDTNPGARNSSVAQAIKSQRIPGRTWQEKAKHFFDKLELMEWTDGE